MKNFSSNLVLQAAKIGGYYLNQQYQRIQQEAEQCSDYDLFEWIDEYPKLHIRYLIAYKELLKRGYPFSIIRK